MGDCVMETYRTPCTYGSVGHSEDPSKNLDDDLPCADDEAPRETEFLLHQHDDSRISVESSIRPRMTFRMIQSIVLVLSFTATLFVVNVSAWTIRMPGKNGNHIPNAAAVATLSVALLVGAAMPSAAHAMAIDFSGSYADPFHPNCQRHVEVVSPTRAAVTGTDGTPGCPPDGSGRPWALTGFIEGDSILIDFTPKGGPKDLKGVWEPSPVAGIRFPDGNLWSKKPTIQ
jgi:hypothetical protein